MGHARATRDAAGRRQHQRTGRMGSLRPLRRRTVRHELRHTADAVTTPLLAARGEAVVPSTVDVFIDGRTRCKRSRPAGSFLDREPPVITGTGQLQVVVTDALGRQQVVTQPYYSGSALLRAGLNEYSFEVGAIREDYGLESFAYGDVARRRHVPPGHHGHVHRRGARRNPDRRRQCPGAGHGVAGRDARYRDRDRRSRVRRRRFRLARRPRRRAQRAEIRSLCPHAPLVESFVQVGLSGIRAAAEAAHLCRGRCQPCAPGQPAGCLRSPELLGRGRTWRPSASAIRHH